MYKGDIFTEHRGVGLASNLVFRFGDFEFDALIFFFLSPRRNCFIEIVFGNTIISTEQLPDTKILFPHSFSCDLYSLLLQLVNNCCYSLEEIYLFIFSTIPGLKLVEWINVHYNFQSILQGLKTHKHKC